MRQAGRSRTAVLAGLPLLASWPRYWLFRRLGLGRPLPLNLTFSLLFACNSRCKTCNVYTRKVKLLTLDEYAHIFRHLGRTVRWVTLSGGEPFLRQDITAVGQLLYGYCRPRIINIPTNGTLPERVIAAVEALTLHCSKSQIIVNLSLDEIGTRHDDIRGTADSWSLAMQTFRGLKSLKLPNLTVGIHTVISRFNVARFPVIHRELRALQPDSYITEVAEERAELRTIGTDIAPSAAQYARAVQHLINDVQTRPVTGTARLVQALRLQYYRFAQAVLHTHAQVLPCYAGVASAHVAADGEVWPCCVRGDSMGNLRQVGYDFRRLWKGTGAMRIRQSIKRRECHCPLANAAYTTMLYHPKTLLQVGMNYLKLPR
jgi:MoaA/NifB/PqqE/SkfB family radical SAM enzyme